MPLTVADRLLDELVAIFREQFMRGPHDALRKDLYVRVRGGKQLPKSGGFSAGAAAFLALQADPRNPWFGRGDLLDLAFVAGERLLVDHAEIGVTQVKPSHFTIYPMPSLYHLAAEQAGAARRNRWRELMARNLKQVEATVDRCWQTLGRPAPHAGTGPNHFFGWIAVGYAEAQALGDDRMLRKLENAMLKHLAIQLPIGYFPEHDGPAVMYQTVSLEGVAEFHACKRLPTVEKALHRGVDFFLHTMYPDLRGIETFDERNRLSYRANPLGALVWTPAGRRLLSRLMELRAVERTERLRTPQSNTGGDRSLRGVNWWPLGGLYRTLEQSREAARRGKLTEKPLPVDPPRASWTLENRGLVRHAQPWFYALSAWCNTALPGNPYHLERNQAFSLYHDKVGLIVGGGNDKRAPHNATIHVVEEGEVHYYPPIAAALEVAKPPRLLQSLKICDRLKQDYGCAQVQLEAAPVNARRFRLAMTSASNMVNHEVALVLQLTVTAPTLLRTGAAAGKQRAIRLKKQTVVQPLETIPLGTVLELPGKWRLKLSPGASLQWPHRPWNPYLPPEYRVVPQLAVALVRIPIQSRTGQATATVEIL